MKRWDVKVEVHKVEGDCPIFHKGDSFLIKNGYILESTMPLCIHALKSILHFAPLIARGFTGADLGLGTGKEAYISCPDPGYPLTPGGNVIFKLTTI